MTDKLLQGTIERVSDLMDEIAGNFKTGIKITVLVRTPDNPSADFCLTSDTLDEIAAMVQRRKENASAEANVSRQGVRHMNIVDGKIYIFISEDDGIVTFKQEGRETLRYLSRAEFDNRFFTQEEMR